MRSGKTKWSDHMLTKTLARRAMQEKITAGTATEEEIRNFHAAEAHRLKLGIVSLPLTTSLTDPRLTELCNKFVAAAKIAPPNTQIEILGELTERAFSVPKKYHLLAAYKTSLLPFNAGRSDPQALRAHAALLAWASATHPDIPEAIKSLDTLPGNERQRAFSDLSIPEAVTGFFLSRLPS
jgi:hypothetical protein